MRSIGLFVSLLLIGCASDIDKKIEEIRFLLDHGKFSEAVTEAQQVVDAAPDNQEGQFLLATALFGDAVLTARTKCKNSNDTGYLGLVACIMDSKTSGTDLGTFTRIAPDDTTQLDKLEECTNTLVNLTATATGARLQDVYLQLWVSRLFEIAGVTTRLCVPTFNPSALTSDEITRFQTNLGQVNDDAAHANLPSSFDISTRIGTILADFLAAIAAAGDQATGAAQFFTDNFGAAACS